MRSTEKLETTTLAGGCFWCTEVIFKRLKGVISVMPGYAGGKIKNPTYENVSTGRSGHAESVQITFDQSVISFSKLLDVFWQIHDPTTLNRQGNDIGSQYRSVIFYHNNKQKRQAEESKDNLEKSAVYPNPIVTEITPYTNFYPAEISHQEYYEKHSDLPYCQIVIDPKIQKLLKEFPKLVK